MKSYKVTRFILITYYAPVWAGPKARPIKSDKSGNFVTLGYICFDFDLKF